MAFLLAELAEALVAAAMGAAEGEVAAVGATAAAEAAAATAAEATAAAAAEGTAAAEAAAAEAMAAAEAAEAEAAAASAAAEAAAAEAATAEAETVEAAEAAQAEAEAAAKEAAELEASLGARIGGELGSKIVSVLKTSLKLVKTLIKKTLQLVLLKRAIDQIPEKYRKVLAGMVMSLAATASKLLCTSYKFAGLSGGSEEGKQVAKDTKAIVDDLHTTAHKLTTEPSKVKINTETHEPMMEDLNKQADSNKKEIKEINDVMAHVEKLMKEHVETNEDKQEKKKKNIPL